MCVPCVFVYIYVGVSVNVCVCVCYEWRCCVSLYMCCSMIDSMDVTPLNKPQIQTFKPTFQQPTIYPRKHHIVHLNTPHSTPYPRTSNPTYLSHDAPELISVALDYNVCMCVCVCVCVCVAVCVPVLQYVSRWP